MRFTETEANCTVNMVGVSSLRQRPHGVAQFVPGNQIQNTSVKVFVTLKKDMQLDGLTASDEACWEFQDELDKRLDSTRKKKIAVVSPREN